MDSHQIWTIVGMGTLSLTAGYCLYGLLKALLIDIWAVIRPILIKYLI